MNNDFSMKIAQIRKDLDLYAKEKVDRQYILEKTASIIDGILGLLDENINASLTRDNEFNLFHYSQLIDSIIHNSISPVYVKFDLLEWDKMTRIDQIMSRTETEGIHQVHEFEVVPKEACIKLVYLDQNIISHLFDENSAPSLNGYAFVFSPAHIEDMISSSDQTYHTSIIQYISFLTNDLEILYSEDGASLIGKESPQFVYDNRVVPEIHNINAAKDIKVIDYSINLLFNQTNTEKFNGTDLIEHPQEFCKKFADEMNQALAIIGAGFTIEELLYNHDEITNYQEVNSYIHALYHLMDVIGFKRDNISSSKINTTDCYKHEYYQKIRSSRIDIEHLLYAFPCDYFFTMDKRLYYRAKIIYSLMNSKCQPILIGKVHGGIENEIKNKLP